MTEKNSHVYYMNSRPLLYEGHQKDIYDGHRECTHVMHFKDTLRLKENVLHIPNKGIINNRLSATFFKALNELGLFTHFIQHQNEREQLVHGLEMFPFRVKVRNLAAGSIAARLGVVEGTSFHQQVIDFYSKVSPLPSPLITADHMTSLGWITASELEEVIAIAKRAGDFVSGFFMAAELQLVDVVFEFGRFYNPLIDDTQIMLADEISLDTCHVWDMKKGDIYGYKASEDEKALKKNYEALSKKFPLLMLRPHKSKTSGGVQLVSSSSQIEKKVVIHGHHTRRD